MTTMYRVTAPYVTVRVTPPGGGETVLGFYEGGVLPDTALQESIDSLLAKGMIEELDSGEAKAIEKSEADAEKQEAASAKATAEAAEKKKADDEAVAKKAEEDRLAAEKSAAVKTAKAESK